MIIIVGPVEKAVLVTYQLKVVSQFFFNKEKEGRAKFNIVFLDRFFPFDMRWANVLEFIKLHHII